MSAAKITLLDNRTTDGTDGFEKWQRTSGTAMITGHGEVYVTGTFGGASVGFFCERNGEDVPVLTGVGGSALAITSAEMVELRLVDGEPIKAVVSGATGTTDLTCEIFEYRG